ARAITIGRRTTAPWPCCSAAPATGTARPRRWSSWRRLRPKTSSTRSTRRSVTRGSGTPWWRRGSTRGRRRCRAPRPRRRPWPRSTPGSLRLRDPGEAMGKRIQFDDEAREALRRGVEQLAGVGRVTLGPRGRNVVIEHGSGAPTITNDGLAISREVELADRFENMGAQLVKEVALKTGEVAGDGTTTATVLAHAIVTRGLKAIAAGHGPMHIRRGSQRARA